MTTDDELGQRIRRLADALPVRMQEPPVGTTIAGRSRPHIARRAVLVASAVAIVVVTVALVAGRDDSRPSRVGSVPASEVPTTNAPPPTSPSTVVTTTEPSATTDVDTTTVDTTTGPPPTAAPIESVTEPVIDLDGCTPTWARSSSEGLRTIDGFFARHSSLPIAYQVFGDPSGSLAEPFAMMMRIFADQRTYETTSTVGEVDVNGSHGVLLWHPAIGRATLHWLLPDGSEAYLRSDSLDGDGLLALARSLVARSADATVPGFDLADGRGSRFAVLGEEFGSFPSAADTTSECVLADGSYVRASIITLGVVAAAAVILDRAVPPRVALRQLDHDHLLLIAGRPSETEVIADAIDHVRQATPAEWTAMTAYPTENELTAVNPPIDADAQYRLATRTYTTPEDMSNALVGILQERVPEADATETRFTTYSLYGTFPSFVVSKNELDDSVVATRWLVMYEQDSTGQYSVHAVYRTLLCRDGTVVSPDGGLCP